MNSYTQLLYYIKGLAEFDPFVNEVAQGVLEDSQLNKANIYPLLHIDILDSTFLSDSVIRYSVKLTCLNERDTNKEIITDKFWKQDNEVDNFNETQAVLNRLWLIMLKDFEKENITASESPSLEKLYLEYGNEVDGWSLNFEVDMPNIEISLCS